MVKPDDIDPAAIHPTGAFGQFEMEAGAAAIVAYAQHRGDKGPFKLGQLVDFAHDRRNLSWTHPKRLPGEPAEVEKDITELASHGWVSVQGREVIVGDDFWARCLEKAPAGKGRAS